jgi:mono/diheme cytochrome c family protein
VRYIRRVIFFTTSVSLAWFLACHADSQFVQADSVDANEQTFQQTIRPLLQQHCTGCHGEKKAEAEFRIDLLGHDMLADKTAEVWHELIDRVNSGEMPPKDEPQLTAAELNQLTQWVFGELKRVTNATHSTGRRAVIRRLNRQEYTNTIRDLVGVPFEAGEEFPADPSAHGFDNIGSALSISPLHMEKYVRAATKVVDRAIVTGEQPKRETWRIQAERRSKESRGYYYENDAEYGGTGVLPPGASRGRFIAWHLGGGVDFWPLKGFQHLPPVDKTQFRTNVVRAMKFTYLHPCEYIIRARAYGH